ncbi:hypothetical protein AVEN_262160-1 [Araneus ventricosus]|uniref:Uncharacterized protein n=1 Tax=Araneus ventricosus TaxID=182803 RepID=A0A4Y2EHW6_ARAVE|nr:hypothetical protein AVEN_262160-1 [Araneus ventricosus]
MDEQEKFRSAFFLAYDIDNIFFTRREIRYIWFFGEHDIVSAADIFSVKKGIRRPVLDIRTSSVYIYRDRLPTEHYEPTDTLQSMETSPALHRLTDPAWRLKRREGPKGVQTVRKRCVATRRDSLLDKSRQMKTWNSILAPRVQTRRSLMNSSSRAVCEEHYLI